MGVPPSQSSMNTQAVRCYLSTPSACGCAMNWRVLALNGERPCSAFGERTTLGVAQFASELADAHRRSDIGSPHTLALGRAMWDHADRGYGWVQMRRGVTTSDAKIVG